MHAWKTREAHVHVPGDKPQWCIDNGEGDLIPCGSGEDGKERASTIAETLNLGHVARARDVNRNPQDNPVIRAAQAIYDECQAIDLLMQQAGLTQGIVKPQIEDIRSKLVELMTHSVELQNILFDPFNIPRRHVCTLHCYSTS
jgi:hypothetical protein